MVHVVSTPAPDLVVTDIHSGSVAGEGGSTGSPKRGKPKSRALVKYTSLDVSTNLGVGSPLATRAGVQAFVR